MSKLYVFVDESGQDTSGRFFIVAVVVTTAEYETLQRLCESIEKKSRKGAVKWRRTGRTEKISYLQGLFNELEFRSTLYCCIYKEKGNYIDQTIEATAKAIRLKADEDQRVTIFFDGFDSKKERRVLGAGLRHRGINLDKARGFRKEENSSLLRLADALAGFVRDAVESRDYTETLYHRFLEEGVLVELEP